MSLKDKIEKELQQRENDLKKIEELHSKILISFPSKCNEFMNWVLEIVKDTPIKSFPERIKTAMFQHYDNKPIGEIELISVKLVFVKKWLQFKTDPGIGYLGALGKIEFVTNVTSWEKKFDISRNGIFVTYDDNPLKLKFRYLDNQIKSHDFDRNSLEQFIEAILTE